MSEKEQAKLIIDRLPDYKIKSILLFLRGVAFDDEVEDDLYCEGLLEDYENNPERGDFVSFAEALKECGVTADELEN